MCRRIGKCLQMKLKQLVRTWLSLQVSHRGGTYSIERLLALDEYTTNTSPWVVVSVCVATPLPMIILALSQELVPLQDLQDGWDGNYGFWVRVAITCGVVANAITVQARYLVDGVRLSFRQIALISVCVGIVGAAMVLVFAANVTFPIPFTLVTLSVPYYMILIATFRAIAGANIFREMMEHQGQLLRLVAFVTMEVLLLIVYPAYQALFEAAVHSNYEIPVIMLLPLLKFVMKFLVTLTITHVEDMMPEAVIVTVDFFNAMYLATSMQSASSMVTVMVIMAIDLAQTAMGLLALNRRTTGILTRTHEALNVPENERESVNLLSAVCLLCVSTEHFEKEERKGIRVHSTFRHQLSLQSRSLLEVLGQIPIEVAHSHNSLRISSGSNMHELWQPVKISSVWPQSKVAVQACQYSNSATHFGSIKPEDAPLSSEASQYLQRRTPSSTLLREALAVLLTSECLILTEYLEFVIPIFYGNYMLVMVHLRNAAYHIELTGVTPENVGSTVKTVFVYALLEFASFGVLAAIMQRNCGMRALAHLAFVLRTQMPLIQSKMLLWMVVTLGFRVVHFGMTFRFTPNHFEIKCCTALAAVRLY